MRKIIRDTFNDETAVETEIVGDGLGLLGGVLLTVDECGRNSRADFTPAQARRLAKALKKAARKAEKTER